MTPLSSEMVLYRNIKTKFVADLEEGTVLNYLGFSSCSLSPHVAENAVYGSSGCTLVEIIAPAGTPAIRLDLMPDVQNEPDEVILAPIAFSVTKVDRENSKIYMTCSNPLNGSVLDPKGDLSLPAVSAAASIGFGPTKKPSRETKSA